VNTTGKPLNPNIKIPYPKGGAIEARMMAGSENFEAEQFHDQLSTLINTLKEEDHVPLVIQKWGIPEGYNGYKQPRTRPPPVVQDPNKPPLVKRVIINDNPTSEALKQLNARIEWYRARPNSQYTPDQTPFIPTTDRDRMIYDKLATKMYPWEISGAFMTAMMQNGNPTWEGGDGTRISEDTLERFLTRPSIFRAPPDLYVTLAGPDAIDLMMQEYVARKQRDKATSKDLAKSDERLLLMSLGDPAETLKLVSQYATNSNLEKFGDGIRAWNFYRLILDKIASGRSEAARAPMWYLNRKTNNRPNTQAMWNALSETEKQTLITEQANAPKGPGRIPVIYQVDYPIAKSPTPRRLRTQDEWEALTDAKREQYRQRLAAMSQNESIQLNSKKRMLLAQPVGTRDDGTLIYPDHTDAPQQRGSGFKHWKKYRRSDTMNRRRQHRMTLTTRRYAPRLPI
jgi:hypothetical protein